MVSVIDMDDLDELGVRIGAVNELLDVLRSSASKGHDLSINEIASLLMERTQTMIEGSDDTSESLLAACTSLAFGMAIVMQRIVFG